MPSILPTLGNTAGQQWDLTRLSFHGLSNAAGVFENASDCEPDDARTCTGGAAPASVSVPTQGMAGHGGPSCSPNMNWTFGHRSEGPWGPPTGADVFVGGISKEPLFTSTYVLEGATDPDPGEDQEWETTSRSYYAAIWWNAVQNSQAMEPETLRYPEDETGIWITVQLMSRPRYGDGSIGSGAAAVGDMIAFQGYKTATSMSEGYPIFGGGVRFGMYAHEECTQGIYLQTIIAMDAHSGTAKSAVPMHCRRAAADCSVPSNWGTSGPVCYLEFHPRAQFTPRPSTPQIPRPGPMGGGGQCGGTWPLGNEGTRPSPRPQPTTTPPTGGGGGGTSTEKPILSSADCGSCSVTSRPFLRGAVNGSGVPTTVEMYNTSNYPLSGFTSAVRMSIRAPIKQFGYRVGDIFFWAAINNSGQLKGLSDPVYVDNTSSGSERTLLECKPASTTSTLPSTPASAFVKYDLIPVYVRRTTENIAAANADSISWSEQRLIDLKNKIGTIEFNPVTLTFQNVNLTSHSFSTISRTITAANYDQSATPSVLYVPSDGWRPFKPLILNDGTQNIAWINQGANYTNNSSICYDVEWLTVEPGVSGYGDSTDIIPGTLDASPSWMYTANTHALTGHVDTYSSFQGAITMQRSLSRPRDRLPVASGLTGGSQHYDHQPRKYTTYQNSRASQLKGLNSGHTFASGVNELSGTIYSITPNKYIQTDDVITVASRVQTEHNSNDWNIADFTDFRSLSAIDFAMFLATIPNTFSVNSPLSADYKALELIGFCTYNGSLTAADGNHYCAAIARSNLPTWCTPVTAIGGEYENFVVCTSGCDLVLPYITYKNK
jgi:hypothetical protein